MSERGARETSLAAADLIGTWRLQTWESRGADGSVVLPFGPDPLGYVVYTADSRMITTISRVDRAPIGGDLLTGPAPARLEAFASFVAYSGTFRVDGDDVIHSVEVSLFPNWVGGDQRRHVGFSDGRDTLTLSTDPFASGGRVGSNHLTWQRVRAGAAEHLK